MPWQQAAPSDVKERVMAEIGASTVRVEEGGAVMVSVGVRNLVRDS